MTLKLFTHKNISLQKCPECGEIATLRRSRSRKFRDYILKPLKIKPYSCRSCGWRGRKFTYRITKNYKQVLAIYAILAVITFFLVRVLLKKFF